MVRGGDSFIEGGEVGCDVMTVLYGELKEEVTFDETDVADKDRDRFRDNEM